MAKMSESAQVRMNVALTDAPATALAKVRSFDLTQASSAALFQGVRAIDTRGLWRVRIEDPQTDDEQKRALMAAELVLRGDTVPRL